MLTEYPYEIQLLGRLLLALLCGAMVGYERERHGISAGLRTNILVCVGAALMMVVSKYFYYKPGEIINNIEIGLDPSRIAASIVTGVGFLGAGVIVKEKGSIRGLTTAATLWYNAGIGMACGHGMFILPVFGTTLAMVALTTLKRFSNKIPREQYKNIQVETGSFEPHVLQQLKEFFTARDIQIIDINLNHQIKESIVTYDISVRGSWRDDELFIYVSQLASFEFITRIRLY